MQLTNEFSVAAPIETAWPLLIDIERIAPCVPGFKLTGSKDGEYTGTMKVKVGAVSTSYDCEIRFVEVDEQQHRAVIAARGREKKGQGGVTANIVSTLTGEGDVTKASVVTDVDVTGRVAQFGRGILADVSNRLVKQFVSQLERRLLSPDEPAAPTVRDDAPASAGGGASAAATTNGIETGTAPIPGPVPHSTSERGPEAEAEAEPLDLLAVAGGPLAKRALPAVGLLLMLIGLVAAVRARGGR